VRRQQQHAGVAHRLALEERGVGEGGLDAGLAGPAEEAGRARHFVGRLGQGGETTQRALHLGGAAVAELASAREAGAT
jgi:hypothetical protein